VIDVSVYRYKIAVKKDIGEFECPYCKKVFHKRRSLAGHIGGAHRKFSVQKQGKPYCKFCEQELVKGKNWADWAIKQQNLICKKCKRIQNHKSYQKRIAKKLKGQ
jgi:hypothetical protein